MVQRLPTRIAIDPAQPGIERLRPDMSVVTRIDTASAPRQAARQTEPGSTDITQAMPAS